MLRFFAQRLAVLVPVLVGISLVSFFLLYLIPGDVVDIIMGGDLSDATRAAELRKMFGVDRPVLVRYLEWSWDALRGDLGRSLVTRRPVATEILTALPVTLQLTVASLLVALVVGVPLGVLAAVRRGSVQSAGMSLLALIGLSIPNFWLGILLILGASLYLKWFPPQGLVLFWQSPAEALKQL